MVVKLIQMELENFNKEHFNYKDSKKVKED